MNVSKREQRVLHALAQGGRIDYDRHSGEVLARTRDGYGLADFDFALFKKLKARRLIASRDSGPYHITRAGLTAVRAQFDNR